MAILLCFFLVCCKGEADKAYVPLNLDLITGFEKKDVPEGEKFDEYGNTGRISGFNTIITTIRKRKCSISVIIQDLNQLYSSYGHMDANTIISNCLTHIYYPGLSLETCLKIQNTLGTTTVKHREFGFKKIGGIFSTDRASNMSRSLMTADEIRTMPDGKAIMLHSNKFPVLLDTVPWYRNWRVKARLKAK